MKLLPGEKACALSCCRFYFYFFPYSTVSPLTLLHVSLGTSKVLARYFQVGSLQGFGGVSVGVLQNCVYRCFAKPFCSQTLPKCPWTESSSVLKRPSDSSSALSSVTPRDRLVYASGSVRSTASNNAPYIDRVRQRGRERDTHTHTLHTPTSCIDAHVQELWQNSKRCETQKRRGHHFTLSNSRTSAPTGQHSLSSLTKCMKVYLCCFRSAHKMRSPSKHSSVCLL